MSAEQIVWLPTTQVSKELYVSVQTVLRLIYSGELAAVKTGDSRNGRWRVRRDVLDRYKAQQVRADV